MLRRLRLVSVIAAFVAIAACYQEFVPGAHCARDTDCTNPDYPLCDTTRGACMRVPDGGLPPDLSMLPPQACTQSSQCTNTSQPICDTTTDLCRPCETVDAGVSSECTAKDSSRPLCNSSGQCAECLNNRDCIKQQHTCDAVAGSCVPCVKNADCASGICGAGGLCADPSTLIYVNRNGVSCPGGTGQGTLDDPYCAVQAGLDASAAVAGAKKVVVFSATYNENITVKPTTAAYTVSAVGIGSPVISPTSAGPAVLLSNMGQPINISLDGFVVQNANGDSGINCSSSASMTSATRVTVLRSTLQSNAQYGLIAQKCMLSLDQVIVSQNQVGGISLTNSDMTITNTLVEHNGIGSSGATYGGISISTPSNGAGSVINCTIVDNVVSGGVLPYSGLACSNTTNVLNTVVQGNTGGTSEINAVACKPANSAFVGAAGLNTGTNNVELVTCAANSIFQAPATNDFRPVRGGSCTIVDKGAASATINTTMVTAPDHDLVGTPRPQPSGGMFDIGAYEAK
jgi:hypothetical protein